MAHSFPTRRSSDLDAKTKQQKHHQGNIFRRAGAIGFKHLRQEGDGGERAGDAPYQVISDHVGLEVWMRDRGTFFVAYYLFF